MTLIRLRCGCRLNSNSSSVVKGKRVTTPRLNCLISWQEQRLKRNKHTIGKHGRTTHLGRTSKNNGARTKITAIRLGNNSQAGPPTPIPKANKRDPVSRNLKKAAKKAMSFTWSEGRKIQGARQKGGKKGVKKGSRLESQVSHTNPEEGGTDCLKTLDSSRRHHSQEKVHVEIQRGTRENNTQTVNA